MKFKRKIKNNVILSFLITLLVIIVIDFSFVPQTNSKFVKSGGEGEYGIALKYNVALHSLYGERKTYEYKLPEDTTLPTFTANQENKEFTIDFSINRQKRVATEDVTPSKKDVYNISLVNSPAGCSITTNTNVSYEHPTDTNEKILVTVRCDERSYTKENDIKFSIKVTEKIGEEERAFDYADYNFIIEEAYYKDKMGIIDWQNPLVVFASPNTGATGRYARYEDFVQGYYDKFIKPYYTSRGYTEKEAKSYFEKYMHMETSDSYYKYITDSTANKNTYNTIRGLSIYHGDVTIDGTTKNGYIYKVEDSLLGYILTSNESDLHNMYFSSKFHVAKPSGNASQEEKDAYEAEKARVKKELEEAFDYYLRRLFPASTNPEDGEDPWADYNAVWNYIAERGGIYSIVIEGKRMLGVDSYSSKTYKLTLSSDILAYAKSLKFGAETFHGFGNIYMDNRNEFKIALGNISEEIVSNYLRPTVENGVMGNGKLDSYIRQSIYKNSKDNYSQLPTIPASFVDYYIIYDEGGTEFGDYENPYVIVRAWSNAGVDTTDLNNRYKFWKMEVPKEMSIAFVNTDHNTVTITITHDSMELTAEEREDITEIVDNISSQLNLEIHFEAEEVDDDDHAVLIYTFSKGCQTSGNSTVCNAIIPGTERVETTKVEESSTQAVQASIDRVTAAVDTASEMKDNNIISDLEENSGFPMVSSIMKLLLAKE